MKTSLDLMMMKNMRSCVWVFSFKNLHYHEKNKSIIFYILRSMKSVQEMVKGENTSDFHVVVVVGFRFCVLISLAGVIKSVSFFCFGRLACRSRIRAKFSAIMQLVVPYVSKFAVRL